MLHVNVLIQFIMIKELHMVVSTQNNGAIADLPYDCIVEISCIITGKGAMPLNWGKFNSAERGWVQCMKAMEECVIKAAITGNYGLAFTSIYVKSIS